MKKLLVGILLLMLACLPIPNTAWAADTATADLEAKISRAPELADLLTYGYRHSPAVQAARAAWQAEVARYRVETGYPDPQLMATYFPDPIETRLGPQDWNATLTQTIPFPGKLSKAGELVAGDARLAKLELDKAVRELVVALRESYQELLYIQEAQRVARQNMELLDHLRKVAETGYGEERATLVDVTKAQSQAAQLRYDLLLLQDLEQTEKVRLNSLLNRQPAAAIGTLQPRTLEPLAYDLQGIYQLATANQEEIKMADTREEKAQAKKDLAAYQFLPDFKLGLFYAGIGEPDVAVPPQDAGRDAVGVQFGLSIPLWFGKNKGRLDQARAEVARARALKESQINESQVRVRELFFRLENARRLVTLYSQELLPQAAKALELSETWYQEGQGSFTDFLETQATFYNFQLAKARAAADYGKVLARLERLAGTSLTRKPDRPSEEQTAPAASGGRKDAS